MNTRRTAMVMIANLLDTIAANPPDEVRALISLMDVVLQDDRYRELVNTKLKSLRGFQDRKALLEIGYFSGQDLLNLVMTFGLSGANISVINSLIDQLVKWMLVLDSGVSIPDAYARFSWNKERISAFRALNILDNVLLGSSYVEQKYRPCVPAILARKSHDESTGTGFLVATRTGSDAKRAVVTAKHNVDPKEGIQFAGFYSPSGVIYRALATEWTMHPTADLAVMPVESDQTQTPIYPVGSASVLSRTITLGYPRIATTAETYLLAHGGEVNAVVTNFQGEPFVIISNLVAPGNSGGPVLDEVGLCVGMVVRSFETRHDGGVSSVSAAIPASLISDFVATILEE